MHSVFFLYFLFFRRFFFQESCVTEDLLLNRERKRERNIGAYKEILTGKWKRRKMK